MYSYCSASSRKRLHPDKFPYCFHISDIFSGYSNFMKDRFVTESQMSLVTMKICFSHRGKYLAIISMAMVILTGCVTVGPDYAPPITSTPPTWHSQLEGGLTAEETTPQTLAAWWTTLNDPELSSLIGRAASGNIDLKKAQARVREARARRGIAEAGLFPTLDAASSATWSRSSEDAGTGKSSDLYAASFDAAWELDIFGGVRRSVEAAEADLQASQENLRNVLVSLLAEVALNYLDVRTYQVRLTVAEANLESQSETYQLTQWRYEAGLSDELAVQQARYNFENTRSQMPILRTGLEAAMNRVAVLLGEQPGKVHAELEQRESIPVPPLNVAVGVPADALRRRPDVRKAERELAAQTARIGVATADLYPKLSLSGSIGLETLSLNNPSSGSVILSGGPQITWAIFRGGAIRQNIEVQSALQEQALIQYEAAILAALEEVENALVAYAEVQQRRHSLSEATQAAKNAVELAQHKYQAGLSDFTNVLDAQRSLLSFQEQLAQSKGNVTSNLVRLYKALGGGWTSLDKSGKK
jgi:outer membrane protein, multidrug efflux system